MCFLNSNVPIETLTDRPMHSTESTSKKEAVSQTRAMEKAPPQRRTVWTLKERIIRLLWGTVGRLFWCLLPVFRSTLINLFGGKVGKGCTFARSVEVTIPWNITMGDDCHVANHVILYSLGPITLGNHVRIDTRAHLCAGSHDMRDTTFPLTKPPISIGDDSFIGVDAYISPNITLGANTIVYPRASVYKNYDGDVSLQGNPARSIK